MSELSVAASSYRTARFEVHRDEGTLLDPCPGVGIEDGTRCSLAKSILASVEAGDCPSGWPVYDPDDYSRQLAVKASLLRDAFPEADLCCDGLEVKSTPPSHHRQRAKVGIVHGKSGSVDYGNLEDGVLNEPIMIASETIVKFMPMLIEAVRIEQALSQGLTMVSFLSTRNGPEVVACLVYGAPLCENDWEAAAHRSIVSWASSGLEVSLLGQARGVRIDAGKDHVLEEYRLADGRTLKYRHTYGHFSNPNAYANVHTLDFLSSAVKSIPQSERQKDLLELYCGNGNHTVALAPWFRGALAVEINPTLVEAARMNLQTNGVDNCSVQVSPSADFCNRILRNRRWIHKPSGREFDFGTVVVDPPRTGLDSQTRVLVAKYDHILYISCNPFVSLRRDLDDLKQAGFQLKRIALIDHFPYTPHTEAAVYLSRD